MYRLLILLLPIMAFADDTDNQKVSDMKIEDFTKLVRIIIQETLSYCVVTGQMEGKAKFNLDVKGEVFAKLECNFEDLESPEIVEKE